ncbi:hypothetical protein [Pseudonocardia sp. H11422]|uniref:hypothetical protein n=1 Tax=Pseudonocardia sp. H11422 TaxID=2835866 RepID=UPI001BDD7653|nr:hypothetical protein [Pseudonocardia sp. H11422]
MLTVEQIVQIAPAFILGLYWRRLSTGSAFWGMLVGALLAGGRLCSGSAPSMGCPEACSVSC